MKTLKKFMAGQPNMTAAFNQYSGHILSKSGIGKVGTGTFSTVIATKSDPENVVKISRSYNKVPEADPFRRFAEYSMHSANPHLPRVHKIQSVPVDGGNIHIVKMEKLHSIDKLQPHERLNMFKHAFGTEVRGAKDISADGIAMNLRLHMDSVENDKPLPATIPQHLKDALHTIHKSNLDVAKNHSYSMPKIDIHGDNIMARKSGDEYHMVINDPVVSSKDVYHYNQGK